MSRQPNCTACHRPAIHPDDPHRECTLAECPHRRSCWSDGAGGNDYEPEDLGRYVGDDLFDPLD